MAGGNIFVRHVGAGQWSEPERGTYADEAQLQQILREDPTQVPNVPAGSYAVTELPTIGGPADVCIVAPDGSLVVVECKLSTNSEKRRMVIGQVQDYASAIAASGADAFRRAWRQRDGADLEAVLEPHALEQLSDNIAHARIHLCVAIDVIDADLRRLIEHLNRTTRDDITVTALQLGYARHGDVEILIPTTFGGEIAAAKTRQSKESHDWTKDLLLAAIADERQRFLVSDLMARVEQLPPRGGLPPIDYGRMPSGGVNLHLFGFKYAPVQLWANARREAVLFPLWKWYKATTAHPGFAELARLLGRDHASDQRVTGVPLDRFPPDELWDVLVRTAEAINGFAADGGTP